MPTRTDRVLTTLLFTDIVGSTVCAAKLGDRRWRRLLDAHDASVRGHAAAHGGRVLKNLGDGYLATFERPVRAIRCARAVREDATELGLEMKAGIHTGECDRTPDSVAGL